MKALVRKILPIRVRAALRRTYVSLSENGRTHAQGPQYRDPLPGELLPPKDLQRYIGGGFKEAGPEFFRYFVELCDLKPDEKVLDVGSGSGRMAVPLTDYLSARGRYEGFDINPEAVKWCTENITSRFPHFNFQVCSVYNPSYNSLFKLTGQDKASEFRFPYEDGKFDLVFLTSVFTHMLQPDMENYFAEIARVLKRGGRCLITFFLLNDESTVLIDNKKGEYNFEHLGEGYRTIDKERPEDAVAYPETYIRSLFEKNGLRVKEPVRYGAWCGRVNYLSFQDIVIAVRADGA